MLLSYVKSKIGNVKERLGWGSTDDFEQVNSAVDNIFEQESEINQEFANINEKFESKADQAYERMLEPEEETYSLEDEQVEDTRVQVNRGVRGLSTSLFSDGNFIEIEAGNVLEYVEELGEEMESREAELEKSGEMLEEFGSETVGELLGTETSEADSYAESIIKSADAGGILEQKNSELEAERDALEDELARTVERYTRQMYKNAQELSEQLGGTARSEEGEFDILRNIADSRRNLLQKSRSNTAIDRTSALETSGEAIGAQSQLVKQYLDKLDSYQDSMEQLFSAASEYLDKDQLYDAAERVEALDEGLDRLSNIVNDNSYDTVQDALVDTVRSGMSEDEPDPAQYFRFEETSSYSQNEQQDNSEEAIL